MARMTERLMGGTLIILAMLILTPPNALAAPAPFGGQPIEDNQVCGTETIRQEKAMGIPDRLLHAISLVESGRWDDGRRETLAWPWTIMAEGQGRFLPSKASAIAEVRKLQARGVKNIDVGCMQVNLLAHPDAFATLDDAFEPATNVAYAGRFLLGLYGSTQNWATAGAYYHSQTPSEAAPYKAKLLSTWNTAKGKSDGRIETASLSSSENQPPVGLYMPQVSRPAAPAIEADSAHILPGRAAPDPNHVAAERAEAKRIADAYRQARLEEYQLRRAQMSATKKG